MITVVDSIAQPRFILGWVMQEVVTEKGSAPGLAQGWYCDRFVSEYVLGC